MTASGVQGCHGGHALSALCLEAHSTKADDVATFEK